MPRTPPTPPPPPHPAPRLHCRFPDGLAGPPGLCYAPGSRITITVRLTREGDYASPISSASGSLTVETTEGHTVLDLGTLSSEEGEPKTIELNLPPGRYRLVVSGTATLADGSERDFVVRSRPLQVLPAV